MFFPNQFEECITIYLLLSKTMNIALFVIGFVSRDKPLILYFLLTWHNTPHIFYKKLEKFKKPDNLNIKN